MSAKSQKRLALPVFVLLSLASALANAGNEGTSSTFYGQSAGSNNNNGGSAGFNSFFGLHSGISNTTGVSNSFFGSYAGLFTDTGSNNTYLVYQAGYYATGNGNVFLGMRAGFNEAASNKLYIDNCFSGGTCSPPLVYGEFDNHLLKLNGVMNVSANAVARSQLHFSLADTDSGGWLTSVLENNFFMSSGARFDATAGGWTQRSSDQQATIAGSGVLGYRIFTDSGHAVGSNFTPTVRLHIDYNGNLGLNQLAVAGTPIQHSSGAHLTVGGVWTDASSREYKEHIAQLSAEDALRTFAALAPVTYNYKADSEEKHVGFIAEDVPELVATKDRRSLSPMDIVAVLTKVTQQKSQALDEQKQTMARQEAELMQLKDQLASLTERMRRLEQSEAAVSR
jgi:hypothetical protein